MVKKRMEHQPVSGIVTVDLQHWSHSILVFQDDEMEHGSLYGYNLLRLAPSIHPGHGIKLKVTVEVIDPGVRCDVRIHGDGLKCTKPKAKKRKAIR